MQSQSAEKLRQALRSVYTAQNVSLSEQRFKTTTRVNAEMRATFVYARSAELQALSNSLQLAYSIRRRRKSSVALIDKLEVRIPERAPFTSDFKSLSSLTSSSTRRVITRLLLISAPIRTTRILHYGCRHGEERNHKLELVDTGVMTLAEMREDIQRVFRSGR